MRHLSADPDRDPSGRERDGEGRCVMGNSTKNKEPGDMAAKAWVLDEHEFSRKSFLRAGGSLVIGMSLAGTVASKAGAANDPGALSTLHTGAVAGPPDPTQIDSWLQVNPDNSVTLFHGWAELGQGSPTAVRMIAAEELGLSMEQV